MTNFLKDTRDKNNWTQEEMAGILGVSRPTYVALEKGKGSVTVEQVRKLANRLGCEIEDVLTEKIADEEKYRDVLLEAIRHGADSDGKVTKTKLAKLIYLADFGWYYHHLEPMTGASYRRIQQGPVPNIYFSVIDELFEKGLIDIQIKDSAQMISLTTAGKKQKPEKLSTEESEFVKEVASKWRQERTSAIVRFTHQQLPYRICNDGEVIPYELITQQEPEYVY